MNSDYCSSCGGKIEYLLKKPNFCPHCGTAISKGSIGGVVSQQQTRSVAADDDPEGTDVLSVPQVHKLEYEVDGEWTGIGRSHGSLGDVLNLGEAISELESPAPQLPSKAKAKKKSSSKKKAGPMSDAVKQSIKECKSSAGKPVDVG